MRGVEGQGGEHEPSVGHFAIEVPGDTQVEIQTLQSVI